MSRRNAEKLPFQSVTVTALRGLKDVEISDCVRVNVLVGGNNSGKTTALEALMLLAEPQNPAQWRAAVELRGSWPLVDNRSGSGRRLDAVKWLFPDCNRGHCKLEVAASGLCPVQLLSATFHDIYGDPPRKAYARPDSITEGLFRPGSAPEPGLELEIRMMGREGQQWLPFVEDDVFRMVLWEGGRGPGRVGRFARLPVVFATPISHRSDHYLMTRVSRLIRVKRKHTALDLLRAIDDRVNDFVLATPEGSGDEVMAVPKLDNADAVLHLDYRGQGLVPIHSMGDGIRRALHLAALLAEVGKGGVLLIDELEVGMHTSVLTKVFDWLCQACATAGVQLFATTHSLEAVDAILEAVPDSDLALYRLEKAGVKRYSGDLLRVARVEFGQEVR